MKPWLATLACFGGIALGTMAQGAEETRVGMRIDEFRLPASSGVEHALSDVAGDRLTVVAFLGVECPLAKLYAPRLQKLQAKYASQGVAFLGIDSNEQDSLDQLSEFVAEYGLAFPLVKDEGQVVADRFGAVRNPEVFVLDANRVVRYRGRIDDQFGLGFKRPEANRHDLAAALDELLAERPVSQPSTEAVGCFIGRAPRTAPQGDVTYSNQIARILNQRCVECHREGELAPFSMASYDEVVLWAETIREAVLDGRMPPWFADPRHGHFANDFSISAEERELIDRWVTNGCPEGEAANLPEPPSFVTGWRIGEPDAVYEMEETFAVPADGTVDYQHFLIGPKFEEDVWISAAEARPGNSAVVHHIVLFAVPGDVEEVRGDRRGGIGAFGQMVAIYAPGMPPWDYPEGTAMQIKAGSKLVMQMHYTPSGTAQDDRSYVGVRFAQPDEVQKRIRYGMAINVGFEIPPHEPAYEVTSGTRFRRDTLLLNLFPHMHYRGKSFDFTAIYPDGTSEVLLSVPRYDFNWQLRYDLAEPKLMPKGTRLVCRGLFDNSASNPRNPDPEAEVRFGLQSWEEMMVGYYTTVAAAEDLRLADDESDE